MHAFNNMWPNSSASMQFRADNNMFYFVSSGEGLPLHQITLLLYANNMVLFSTNLKNLVLMLQCMDTIAERFTMRINAAHAKVMSMGKGDSRLLAIVTINGGKVEQLVVSSTSGVS